MPVLPHAVVNDATADCAEREMHAALEINMPNSAAAVIAADEVVAGLSNLETTQ